MIGRVRTTTNHAIKQVVIGLVVNVGAMSGNAGLITSTTYHLIPSLATNPYQVLLRT